MRSVLVFPKLHYASKPGRTFYEFHNISIGGTRRSLMFRREIIKRTWPTTSQTFSAGKESNMVMVMNPHLFFFLLKEMRYFYLLTKKKKQFANFLLVWSCCGRNKFTGWLSTNARTQNEARINRWMQIYLRASANNFEYGRLAVGILRVI